MKTLEISFEQIYEFLENVDCSFPVPISQKQNLYELAKKFEEKATICAEIRDKKICAMVAGYTDHVLNNLAYISVVATQEEYRGQGIANRLVKNFIKVAENKHLSGVHLYAATFNKIAINMYKKIGFIIYSIPDESRPEDIHLIYYINRK